MIFRKRPQSKQLVAITLGERTTAAVLLEQREEQVVLLDYLLEKSPFPESGFSLDAIKSHIQPLLEKIGNRNRRVAIALNMGEAVLRNVLIPKGELSDQRTLLRKNPKAFFQLELQDYEFDCIPVNPPTSTKPEVVVEGASNEGSGDTSMLQSSTTRITRGAGRVPMLAMGAPSSHAKDIFTALSQMGASPRVITCTQAGLLNIGCSLLAETMKEQVVALVDIGFKHTTLTILVGGEPAMTRVANSGGDTITSNLAEAMNVEYAAAEAVKLTMPEKVEKKLNSVIESLAKELRSVFEFFEESYGRSVTKVFFAGGTAKSKFLIQMLESGLGIPCEVFDPVPAMTLQLPEAKASEFKLDAPQLTIAFGVGLQGLGKARFGVDLLVEKREERARKLRDPVRWGMRLSTLLVVGMLGWAAVLLLRQGKARLDLGAARSQLAAFQKKEAESRHYYNSYVETNRVILHMHRQMTERFLWTGPLEALQAAMVDEIQVTRIKIEENIQTLAGIAARTNNLGNVIPGRAAVSTNSWVMTISANDFANPAAAERFVQSLENHPYFREKLKRTGGIRLKDRLPSRVDPFDPTRTFIPFTIECQFQDRISRDE